VTKGTEVMRSFTV